MTTSKDKTSKISPIVGFTPVSTTTTKDAKDSKTSKASKSATPQQSTSKGAPAQTQTKASDDAWQKRIGAAHKVWSKLSESDLKKSAGVGARIFMPAFGLLGIDWGYGFDRAPGFPDRSGAQFHFTIGQQFR